MNILGLVCKNYEKMEKSEKYGFMWKSCKNVEIWKFEDLLAKIVKKKL